MKIWWLTAVAWRLEVVRQSGQIARKFWRRGARWRRPEGRRRHALKEGVQLPQGESIVQSFQRPDRRHTAAPVDRCEFGKDARKLTCKWSTPVHWLHIDLREKPTGHRQRGHTFCKKWACLTYCSMGGVIWWVDICTAENKEFVN